MGGDDVNFRANGDRNRSNRGEKGVSFRKEEKKGGTSGKGISGQGGENK